LNLLQLRMVDPEAAPVYSSSLVHQKQLLKIVDLLEAAAALSLVRPSLERLSSHPKVLIQLLLTSV
jgi:hypothetical protein